MNNNPKPNRSRPHKRNGRRTPRTTGNNLGNQPFTGSSVVPRNRLTNANFLPRRQIVTCKTQMLGFYNTATARQGGIFGVFANSLFEPFNNVSFPLNVTGATASNISLNAAFSITANPIGYSFLSSNYQYYKVRKARLTVEGQPAAGADGCILTGYANEQQQSGFNPIYPASQPGGKVVFMVNGARPKKLVLNGTTPNILGYSSAQFEGLAPTVMGGTPAGTLSWYFNVSWDTCDGAVPAQQINFIFTLEQEVEVSELIIQTA